MSRKEVPRPGLVKLALAGQITNAQGAAGAAAEPSGSSSGSKPGFGPRDCAACSTAAAASRPRGALPRAVRARVAALLQSVYRDVNDCHATEKLREVRGPAISRGLRPPASAGPSACPPSTAGAPGPIGAAARRRRAWAPSSCSTAVSSPGSETAGPTMTLLGAIDDATGTVVALHFRPAEDLHGYVTLLAAARRAPRAAPGPLRRSPQRLRPQRPPLVARRRTAGRPASDPVRPHPARPRDRLHPGRLAAGQRPHRAPLAHPAGSPRRRAPPRGHPHPEAANAFLPAFLADFNRRFAHPAADPTPAWRRPPRRPRHRAELSLPPHRGRATTPSASAARWIQTPRGVRRGRSYAGCPRRGARMP